MTLALITTVLLATGCGGGADANGGADAAMSVAVLQAMPDEEDAAAFASESMDDPSALAPAREIDTDRETVQRALRINEVPDMSASSAAVLGSGTSDQELAQPQTIVVGVTGSPTAVETAAPAKVATGSGTGSQADDQSAVDFADADAAKRALASTSLWLAEGSQVAAATAEPATGGAAAASAPQGGAVLPLIWQSSFTNGLSDWPGRTQGWGEANRSFAADPAVSGSVMRVIFPKGSIDPVTMKSNGLPYGGTGFRSKLTGAGYEIARLRYKIKFPADFDPALGGKLPGLCGGTCNSGGKPPNGTDGFSVRYMWTGNFAASVYAYLPTTVKYGTPIGSRRIPLKRGNWVELIQEVKLNSIGYADGHIKVWADGVKVVEATGLTFRTSPGLKIDAVMFETFYGGHTAEWATPKDTELMFAEFSVEAR
ncbi:MAG: hypothetical protein JNL87_16250 [Burkholderiaceae bacterium]|nr:hypothetical protein [Burkholderiaceae bacterium]